MGIAALVARLVLALVFIVAGSAKLVDRKGSRQAMVDFGFPAALASPLGILLPLAELAVAVLLLPTATAWWGALGALALLLLFVAGIGLNLARGHKPDCHCFGQIHSAPAGWRTLARNGVLAILAGFLVWQGWTGDVGPSAVSWAGTLPTVQLLGLVVGVLVFGLLVHRIQQSGYFGAAPSQNAVSALPRGTCGSVRHNGNGVQQNMPAAKKIGEPAPKIEIFNRQSGETINLWSIQGQETLVIFYNPNCSFCQQMLPELKQWEEDPPEEAPDLLVISTGTNELGLDSPVLFDRTFVIFEGFGAGETPSAVLVDAEGKIASEVAFGASEVLGLVKEPGRKENSRGGTR